MPRYFFHVHDGLQHTDSDGIELPDLHAARIEAQRFAGEMIRDTAIKAEVGMTWRLEVADEAALMLFCMDFVVTSTPRSQKAS